VSAGGRQGRVGYDVHRRKQGVHGLVDGVDRLKRPDHHSQLDDSCVLVAANDVDTVHVLALDSRLELQHRHVAREHLLGVVERALPPSPSKAPAAARTYVVVMSLPRCGVWTIGE